MSSRFLDALGASRLYPLTDRLISRLRHDEQVYRLSEKGMTLVQLREKILSAREFYEEAASALSAGRERGVTIIVNDRVDIALALKADGVHLGQDDMPAEAARRLLGPDSIIGVSTHTLEQAQGAAELPVDYVAIGPLFSTVTKESSHATLGLDSLRLVRRAVGNMPLVAIGGIKAATHQAIIDAGADGIAIISDLWSH
ncbi:MAG TPA: thiamine phosphate synthase [Pyrinomonadaceae bacterium]|nr:thiamine phosphate synthase [Pyrinomonadaceae bacterium]